MQLLIATDVLRHHNGQLSSEVFNAACSGTLDPNNRWVVFSSLMPWEELEETYATQFSLTTGAPAKPVRLNFGVLFIKQRLGLTDEETVERIRENAHMLFSWVLLATPSRDHSTHWGWFIFASISEKRISVGSIN
jgi:hypothetical protein